MKFPTKVPLFSILRFLDLVELIHPLTTADMEELGGSTCETLSDEDYQRLPSLARAYEGCAENETLRVSPSVLKFPRNDPSLHLGKLVVWNKTKKRVNFRLVPPKSKHFSLFFEKSSIYGGGEETIYVRVKPYDEHLLCSSFQIQIINSGRELSIPIELLPDTSWFQLPKIIIMPILTVGQSFDGVISLPKAEDGDEIYFFVSHVHSNAITISPPDGVLRRRNGGGGTESLVIRYHPREYTTLVHTLFLHFPSIQKRPYDITLYLRALPTTYRRNDGVSMFPPLQKPPPTKPTKLKQMEGKEEGQGVEVPTEDLTTPAAVAKFLLRPAGESSSSTDLTDATGQTQYESHRNYKMEEKKFYEKTAQLETSQQNLHLQPSRVLLGQMEADSDEVNEIKGERDDHQFIYQKWLGLDSGDIEDLTRERTKMVRRRGLRDLDTSFIPTKSKPMTTTYDPVRRHILRPFIQAALTLLTRHRATKRILKLRILIKEYKELEK